MGNSVPSYLPLLGLRPLLLRATLGCLPLWQQLFSPRPLNADLLSSEAGIQFLYLCEDKGLSQLSRDSLLRFHRVWVLSAST